MAVHETVTRTDDEQTTDTVEQIRRMLANPRRTRR